MLNDVEQKQETGNDCINQQAGRDINNFLGIPEEELDKKIEEKCKAISFPMQQQICVVQQQIMSLQNNLISITGIAQDNQRKRCKIFGNIFTAKLLDEPDNKKEKIFKAFEEPTMLNAFFNSQKCYALSNDEDHLNILTNMLIEKASSPLKTNKQMLIDDAIDIMPRLNQKHLDILAFLASFDFRKNSNDVSAVTWYIDNILIHLKKVLPLNSLNNYLEYLSSKNCISDSKLFRSKKSLENILNYIPCLHSGFPKDEYFNEINISGAEKLIDNSLLNKENIVIKYSSEELKTMLKGPDDIKEKVIEFEKRNIGPKDDELIKRYLQTNYPEINEIYDNWNLISRYEVNTLGYLIAISYINAKYNIIINWNFE